MANLSQQKRERMLAFLKTLKEQHTTDEEALKALSEIEKELKAKKYGLVWEEHEEAVDVMMRTHIPVFTVDDSREINGDPSTDRYNFLLEGDNLHSLRLLEKTHCGKIDVIYIDPPYNTGNEDFKYDDAYVDTEDGYYHSKWLSFMYERLRIAHSLLSESGVIFISINDNEYAQLKIICDEIFGQLNYQVTFHVQVRYADKNVSTEDKAFKPLMEYILMYSKDSSRFEPNQETVDYGLEKFCWRIKELAQGERFYIGKQEVIVFKKGEWSIEQTEGNLDGLKETWVTGSIYTKMSYGKVFQSVVEPRVEIDGLGCLYKVIGRGDDGLGFRYYTGPQKKTATKGKMYSGVPIDKAEEFKSGNAPQKKVPIINLYDFAPDFGNIKSEGGIGFNSGKKPIKMLKQLINYSKKKDAIVLDFFAGSGSTGHAVIDLNNEDGGTRRFILCTNNEKNICTDITHPRLLNVILGCGKNKGIPANLMYFRTDFVDKESEELSEELLEHIREMIQLEHGVKIDDQKYVIIMDDEEMDAFEQNIENYPDLRVVFINQEVFLSSSQEAMLENIDTYIIPDYYFDFELREAGEIW